MNANADLRRGSALPSLLMALAIVIAAWIVAGTALQIANARSTITVTGSARRQIRSDLVTWRASFAAQSPSLQQSYAELASANARVRSYLHGKGVPDSMLSIGAIQTVTFRARLANGMETGAVSAYRLSQTVEVRSTDVDGITMLARQATELIQQGIELESYPPEYLYTKLPEMKVEMLADATRDARSRAEEMARNAGARIGRLRGARMGVFQITPAFSTQISDYGINDTSSLLKDITAVVSVSFELR
ncbi:MAG: SIMPL domain-containing protein [Candidatus Eisenbacteria bacterium]|uniref:SIMPL domain-containing protein n=1 Tax=Eiseniibacteriota bacterium TaxID=2212470 RepID=A0A849SN76_UNCEI|nr:SIMPL domain-containing protein [Candidatus Eisenbacteria bacterium]